MKSWEGVRLVGPMALPKVTILTPTHRPAFLCRCVQYIMRQTYPKEKLEWVVVQADTHETPHPDMMVHWVRCGGSVGQMRNVGLSVATGELIVHFDDDDWHAPDRIERQVAPFLVSPHIDLVCTDDYYVGLFNQVPVQALRSWSWGYEMFSSGGTFMYRRRAWLKSGFVNMQTGEDYEFAKRIRMRNATSARNLRDPNIFVCVRHGKNTCDFDEKVGNRATLEDAVSLERLMGEADFEATRWLVNGERENESIR
jgi:cellulose synthase/poly-beta-1,6-N-acetylglucosamine synthase-like glycosyltransferase